MRKLIKYRAFHRYGQHLKSQDGVEQQQLDQTKVADCSQQAQKSGLNNAGDWRLDVFRNHFNNQLQKCFVLVVTSKFENDVFGNMMHTSTMIWDPYETTMYVDCYVDTPLDASSRPYQKCDDSRQVFPAGQLQTHIDNYMSN